MCLNVGKTKTTTISRSRTVLPSFPELALNGVALKESSELIILGVTFDPKLSFEQHIRSVAASASQRIGIMRRGLKIFDSVEVVYHCFNSFMLPVLEYASVVRGSAAHSHSALLQASVCCIRFVSVPVIRFSLVFRLLIGLNDLFDVLMLSTNLHSSLFVIKQISILGRSFLHLLTSGRVWVTLSLMVWALAALKLWSTVLCSADHFTFLFCWHGCVGIC